MIMLKIKRFGSECSFGIKCDTCGEPILSHRDGVLLFSNDDDTYDEFIPTLCVHQGCQDKTPNVKSFMTKDLTEFFKVFLPDLRLDKIS